MSPINAKLCDWQRLQVQYDIARSRLLQVTRSRTAQPELDSLRAQVAQLEAAIVRGSQELDALRRAAAAAQPGPADPPPVN